MMIIRLGRLVPSSGTNHWFMGKVHGGWYGGGYGWILVCFSRIFVYRLISESEIKRLDPIGKMLISDIADWKHHITMMNVELDVGCTLKLAVWNRAK